METEPREEVPEMVFKATEDVVRRVMPLLDQLASDSLDKARLLQYLSARAGADWGVLELVSDVEVGEAEFGGTERLLTFRDRASGAEHQLRYPMCLPEAIDDLVCEEYRRLAVDRPLTVMAEPLFQYLYQAGYCDQCRWRGSEHGQIHRECHFAGYPVNFEPVV
jgi:hypothetical protein